MKNGLLIFLAVLLALGGSWCGFVLAPTLQLGGEKQATILNSTDVYPVGRPGVANQGAPVYLANGCAACHTEQVRQDGVACAVVLTDFGSKTSNVIQAVNFILETSALTTRTADTWSLEHSGGEIKVPATIAHGISKEAADKAAEKIAAAGGKVEIHIAATGPDIARGWGMRQSVGADYLYDNPVELGSLRAGPDLSNIGSREDANWQLQHLYAPQSVVKGSTMPPFRYLFEVRKNTGESSPEALKLPPEFAPPAGFEVVPTPEAVELAAYLVSLRANAPLYAAPITP